MNLTDFLIIYLACGAPFGVYYFLQNRTRENSSRLWIKTMLNFLIWIPSALRLLLREKNSQKLASRSAEDSARNLNIHSIGKQLEEIFIQSRLKISIYEFREVFERYVGLTFAVQSNAPESCETEKEFYCATQSSNVELAAICLNRRNRKLLALHQTEALEDFLNLIAQLSEMISEKTEINFCLVKLTEFLGDREAWKKFELMSNDSMQTVNRLNVTITEKDLWKSEIHKPSPDRQISYR